MTDDIKIKVTDAGTSAATAKGVDQVVTSLTRMQKTQEMVAKTSASIRANNYIEQLKKEAAAVNLNSDAWKNYQRAQDAAAVATDKFGNNTAQLRAKLGPTAALVGNLSFSLGELVPNASGAVMALQRTTMAGGQLLGVLGSAAGGPVGIAVGLVSAVAGLATYMASAKKEADDLAKATEANAKAMGSYLDQLTKLRSEVSAARQQQRQETDLQTRLTQNRGSVAEYEDEIATIQKRLGNQYYSDASINALYGQGNQRDEIVKRQRARQQLQDRMRQLQGGLGYAQSEAAALAQQQREQRSAALDFEAAGTPESGGKKERLGFGYTSIDAIHEQIKKIEALEAESRARVRAAELESVNASYAETMKVAQTKYEEGAKLRQMEYEDGVRARQQEARDHQQLMQQLMQQRKLYQDMAMAGTQILAGSAIRSFQMIAKGQKVLSGQLLEGIGDEIVGKGTGWIFEGLAKSFLGLPNGPALIGVGTAAVAFGSGLGAVGARAPGGSTSTGGGSEAAAKNPYGANPYANPSSQAAQTERQPTVIHITMPSVLAPTAEDGRRIVEAIKASGRVYGTTI